MKPETVMLPSAEANLLPSDIAPLHSRGVAQTLAYAAEHSPFYRERLASLRPGSIAPPGGLGQIPFTTKQEVSAAGERLWCVPMERIVDVCTTSGTTGPPLLYPLTEGDLARLACNEFLSFTCAGLTSGDIVLLAVTMDRCFMAGLAYFEGLRRIGCTVVRVGSGAPAMLLSLLDRLQPTAIVSVPSFLKRVAGYASEKGIDLRPSPVAKLICIGEPIRDTDLTLNPLGRRIGDAWGASVFSTYGATELAVSMCECPAGQGGHTHPKLVYIEIVDDAGRPVPDGEIGEMVATTIGVEAMPLIRYRTGDCTFITRQQCACGLWTPRIGPIVGRKHQMMKIKGTTVYPAAVQRVLDSFHEIANYVMIVSAADTLSDNLEVLVAVQRAEPGLRKRIEEQLQGELKVKPAVRIADPAEIDRLQDSQNLRKKRVFIDIRPRQAL